jgi:tRNA(fMet)-specific endonuclease VapC
MNYLLDTNAWIAFLNRRTSKVAHRLAATNPAEVRLCSVVMAELYFGAYKSSRTAANLALLARVSAQYASLPFDDVAADHYGQIRVGLARAGTPIGPNDLMIAAIALARGLTLVTHNTAEFGRVPGLRFEDWEA